MTTAEFLASLRERDVRLWLEDGQLKCDAPPGALDDGWRKELSARKHELATLIADAETTLGGPRSLVPLKPTGEYAAPLRPAGSQRGRLLLPGAGEVSRPAPAAVRSRAQGTRWGSARGHGRGDGGLRGGADPQFPARGPVPPRRLLRRRGDRLRVGEAARPSGRGGGSGDALRRSVSQRVPQRPGGDAAASRTPRRETPRAGPHRQDPFPIAWSTCEDI